MGVPRHKEGVRFRSYLQQPELATVASTIINLFGLEAPSDYEPNLIEVSNN